MNQTNKDFIFSNIFYHVMDMFISVGMIVSMFGIIWIVPKIDLTLIDLRNLVFFVCLFILNYVRGNCFLQLKPENKTQEKYENLFIVMKTLILIVIALSSYYIFMIGGK